MDVGTVPPQAPVGGFRGRLTPLAKGASDGDLVAQIRAGNAAAFESLDARYRAAMLRYCRQLLGDPDEAEDAVQHTFLAAYTSIVASEQAIDVRPWLYVIARNRCYSILRGRREVAVAQVDHGTSEEPGALVQRREDLRDLVLDVSRLPEDQRAALIMAELGARSHDEIAGVLEVPRAKVKALVFQARESLLATRTAREVDCADIRRQLRTVRGGALRRTTLRRHLHECAGCREYRRQLRYQRTRFAAFLPIAPWLALRNLLIRGAESGRATPMAGAGGTASAAVKLGALKPIAGALAAMLSAASAVVAVHTIARRTPVSHPHAPIHRLARARSRSAAPVAMHPAHSGRVVLVSLVATTHAERHAARRPGSAWVAPRRLAGRTAWMDHRALRRVVSRRSTVTRRVVEIRSHPAPPAAVTPPPTVGGPPVIQVPSLPAIPQVPIALPPAVPPVLLHGPNVPPVVPPPNGGPGDPGRHGPGDGHNGPGNHLPHLPVLGQPAPPTVPAPVPPSHPTGTPPVHLPVHLPVVAGPPLTPGRAGGTAG